MRKYLLIIFSFLTFELIICYEIINYYPEEWFVFDFIKPLLIYVFVIIVTILTIIKYFGSYKKSKSGIQLIPLLIVLLGIAVFSVITISKKVIESKMVLYANYDGGTDGLSITLFENNKYKIHDYCYLGGIYNR